MNGKKVKRVRLWAIYLILGIVFVRYCIPYVLEFVDGMFANLALVLPESKGPVPVSPPVAHSSRSISTLILEKLTPDHVYYLGLGLIGLFCVTIAAIARMVHRGRK